MPKPSDIVDFLPARVDGVARRDLEQRLKRLRAARLYPPARAVGERKAEPVNDQYMVNLLLALVGSAEAKYSAGAVQRLYDLPQRDHPTWTFEAEGDEAEKLRRRIAREDDRAAPRMGDPNPVKNMKVVLKEAADREITLGNFLISDIRRARRGELPRVQEMIAVDGEPEVMLVNRATEESPGELISGIVVFGGYGGAEARREIAIRLTDGVIKALADFLGPIEDAT